MNFGHLVSFIVLLTIAPFVYYAIVLYSSWQFSRHRQPQIQFTPPVSILKPIRGLDPEAYENFASLCRQDYPDYEILFCVGKESDPAVSVIQRLAREFPERQIRILFGTSGNASNDKIAKLDRLVGEARHEIVVIGDSDVRVEPDYIRSVVAPLGNPKVGAVTCFYMPMDKRTLAENLQAIGMVSDFYAGILVARQLDGVKFALGPTIVTRRSNLAEFGGLRSIENNPGDDLLIGRLIAERGHEVVLLRHVVQKTGGYQSVGDLLDKRLRWMIVMRHARPWGHFGLVFTQGLAWSLLAIVLVRSPKIALVYLGAYLIFRALITWSIGIQILKQRRVWKDIPLIPVWDVFALVIWLASFFQNKIRWRDGEYYIREGKLCPVPTSSVRR